MPDTSVKVFRSTDSGAPELSGTAGTLIAVLDACLQDGYGSVTLDSLVVASNVATCTKSAGHNFTAIGTVGPVIRIAGATPAGLNGDWRITVTSATQFTFTTSGISDQTATGTITAKRAPAGWTKAFSGTNKAAYARTVVTATAMLLRVDDVDDGSPRLGAIQMYESMSDVDTGSGASSTFYVSKNSGDGGPARPWRIFVDPQMIYMVIKSDGSNWYSNWCFGDLIPYKSGDAYHCVIMGQSGVSYYETVLPKTNDASGSALARSYTQIGGTVGTARYAHPRQYNPYGVASLGHGGGPLPNPVDNSIHFWPVEAWEGTSYPRGVMPGLWSPAHPTTVGYDGTVIDNIVGLDGRSVLYQLMYASSGPEGAGGFDLTGPWR